jgi:phospholipid/cholesterol/gamma-HCH transport system substrate-binding protein
MKFKKELKIGVFVVVVLVTSFFVINYLRGKDIFNREVEVVAYFDTVDGLAASAPVTVKGFKAGKVISVEYMPSELNFKVTCSVMKEFAIPTDSKMTIYSVDLMGSKGVKLDLGSSDLMIEDGATLSPSIEAGLIDGIAGQFSPMFDKVSNTLDSLTVTVSSVNSLLSEANQARISNTLAHLERTMRNISAFSASIQGKSEDLNAFITNLSALSAKLNAIVDNVDVTVDGVAQIVGTISETDIKGIVESFHTLLNNINDPDGTIGKLMADGSVYDSLDTLLIDIDSLVNKIQENPKKYMKLSVF